MLNYDMNLLLYLVLTGFVCTTSEETKSCELGETKCTTDFFKKIDTANDDPDSVKNDPNFNCSTADEYRNCLEGLITSGCPEIDEIKYQDNVKSRSIKLNECPTSGSMSSTSVAVSVILLGGLSCLFV